MEMSRFNSIINEHKVKSALNNSSDYPNSILVDAMILGVSVNVRIVIPDKLKFVPQISIINQSMKVDVNSPYSPWIWVTTPEVMESVEKRILASLPRSYKNDPHIKLNVSDRDLSKFEKAQVIIPDELKNLVKKENVNVIQIPFQTEYNTTRVLRIRGYYSDSSESESDSEESDSSESDSDSSESESVY